MTRFNRRSFLGAGLLGLGAAGMGLRGFPVALATGEGDRYFIFCYFSGGWDPILTLDPRDPAVFTDDIVADTRINVGYDRLRDQNREFSADPRIQKSDDVIFGPYIGDIADHWQDLVVVRGMSMETLAHSGGRRRFITGKTTSGNSVRGSAATTHFATLLGRGDDIPNLAVNVESFNLDQPAYASALRVAGVPDLLQALRPENTVLNDAAKRQIGQLLADMATCPDSQRSRLLREAEAARAGVEELVQAGLDAQFDFGATGPGMDAVRAHYGMTGTGNNALQSLEAQGALAVTAITSGVSRCVTVRVAGGLDTHGSNWATTQGPNQQRGFNLMARMIEDLKAREYRQTGTSWFDHTTLVAFSEFSRTSRINEGGGRDHALTGACLVAGGNIAGGRVIGRSSDVGLAPYPTNLDTGLPDEEGELIHPEHIHRALLLDAGIAEDVMDVRVEPLTALLA
jgi:uncharacterized protein (DUF1501 family)